MHNKNIQCKSDLVLYFRKLLMYTSVLSIIPALYILQSTLVIPRHFTIYICPCDNTSFSKLFLKEVNVGQMVYMI